MDVSRRHMLFLLAVAGAGLAGCSSDRNTTGAGVSGNGQPSAEDLAWVDAVAPKAIAWMTEQEPALLKQGRPLTPAETVIAVRMGVQHPGKIRLLVAAAFPFPADPLLANEARAMGFGADQEGGRSMGYAVLIKPKFQGAAWLLAHECVHIAQRERLGVEAFIRRYLLELRTQGYERSALEAEANRMMETVR